MALAMQTAIFRNFGDPIHHQHRRGGQLRIAWPKQFAAPMLMMDRITEISEDGGLHGKGHVVAEFDITPDLWFFECHFPGNPIMPGCLGLDGLWQLTGFNLGWRGWQGRGYALGVGEVKLTGMVRPDRKMLTYKVDFTKALTTRRLTMGVADGIVEADGEVIYIVKDMKVALSES